MTWRIASLGVNATKKNQSSGRESRLKRKRMEKEEDLQLSKVTALRKKPWDARKKAWRKDRSHASTAGEKTGKRKKSRNSKIVLGETQGPAPNK